MKKLKLIAILFGSALLFMSCDKKGHNDHEPPPPTAMAPPVPVKAPSMIIPVQEAEDMFHRYKTEQVPVIEKAFNIDENGKSIPADDPRFISATTSITFDIKELKQYLKFIEQEADDTKTEITGLRVYFSQYPDYSKLGGGRNTVFLNPLMEYGDKNSLIDDISFAIRSTTVNGVTTKTAVPVSKCYKEPNTNKSLTENEDDTTIIIEDQSLSGNRGGWRPPPENDPNDFQ